MMKKLISSLLIAATLITVLPVSASAAWKQDKGKWWYTEGNSWATGWREIDGKKYYFGNDGYAITDLYEIGNKVYNFASTAELLQSEDLEGDFEIKKEWIFGFSSGHWDSDKDKPYSVTIKIPKKLYYDTLISTKDEKHNIKVPEQFVKRTDDINVFKTFISEVMKVADENNIPEDERVNFLLTATFGRGCYCQRDMYSAKIKEIEINPLKYNLIESHDLTYKANGREVKIPTENFYSAFVRELVYRKTPIESFVEGFGSEVDGAILSTKICSLYGIDSLIFMPNKSDFGGFHAYAFIPEGKFYSETNCFTEHLSSYPERNKEISVIQYNGKSYGEIYYSSVASGALFIGRKNSNYSNFLSKEEFDCYPISKDNA